MRTFSKCHVIVLMIVLLAVGAFSVSSARADEATDEIALTLAGIAADDTEEGAIKHEAMCTLQEMGDSVSDDVFGQISGVLRGIAAEKGEINYLRVDALVAMQTLEIGDISLFNTIASDKEDKFQIRVTALECLAVTGSSDATVRQVLGTIISDTSVFVAVRCKAVSVTAELGIDACELRDKLLSICKDASEALAVRTSAMCAIAGDPATGNVECLVDILEDTEEDGGVRLAALDALGGSQAEVYIEALKGLISTKLSQEQLDLPRYRGLQKIFCPLNMRLGAIRVAKIHYMDNSVIVSALKTVAVDATDDEESRMMAIDVLGKNLVQASATETLSDVLNDEDSPMILRKVALENLSQEKSEAAYSLLCDYVSDVEAPAELRKYAMTRISERIPRSKHGIFDISGESWDDCSKGVDLLLGVAGDGNEETPLRAAAVSALRFASDAGILQALRGIAQNGVFPDDVRLIAINALSNDGGSIEVLEGIANDEGEADIIRLVASHAAKAAWIAIGRTEFDMEE